MTDVIRTYRTAPYRVGRGQNPFRLLPPGQSLKKVDAPEITIEGVPPIKPPTPPRNAT